MPDSRLGPRAVLASGVLLGLAQVAYYLLARPAAVGLDFRVYHVAARTMLAGGDIYAISPAGSEFTFQYPPLAVLPFLPSALANGWLPGFLVHTALTVAVAVAAAWLLLDFLSSLGVALARTDWLLVGAFFVISVHAAPSLVFGQVNHYLAAALVGMVVALARGREHLAGGALGVAAFVKVFPALAAAWLVRRRAWTALATAAGTALALTLGGVVLLGPDASVTYLFDVLLPRRASTTFAGGLDPTAGYVTLRRPLSVLFPRVDPTWYAVGAIGLLAPVVALTYRNVEKPAERFVAVHATLLGMLLVIPSLLVYYALVSVSLVGTIYLVDHRPARSLLVGGALLANLSLSLGGFRDVVTVLDLRVGVVAAARPVFRLGTPVLWGSLLMLAGCVVYSWPDSPAVE